MTSTEEKLNAAIVATQEKLGAADSHAHELDAKLKAHEAKLPRVEALTRLQDALAKLRESGGEDPVHGGAITADSYADIIERAKAEADDYYARLPAIKKERDEARVAVGKITAELDSLLQKLKKEQQRQRQAALEAYRREIAERGFQPREGESFYRSMFVPWGGETEDDRRLRRVGLIVALFTLLIGYGISLVVIPEREVEVVELPPQLAKLLVEREKKPEPKKEEPKVAKREEELKPRKKAPEPTTEQQRRARQKARQSGLLAFSDQFEELKDNAFERKLGSQAQHTDAGQRAYETSRSIVTSQVSSGSGGIVSSQLSRGVGGGIGLGGHQTSRVQSDLAEQLAASADRRITGSGKASRTDEEIQIVFDRNKSALYRLYNRELRKDPTLQGKVVLKLTIAPDGRVTFCKVISSSLSAPELEHKLAQRVKLFNFGAKDVEAVTITYPIDFLPA